VNYWSNPDHTYDGLPMGVAKINNSARVINLRRDTLANFYPPFIGEPPAAQLRVPREVDANQTFLVRVIAADSRRNPLRYHWTAAGFIPSEGTTASLTLTAPDVAQDTHYPISVDVSGTYGTTRLNATIKVRPAPPPITATLKIQPAVPSGGKLPIRVDAQSPTGLPLSYAWSRTTGMYEGNIGNRPQGVYTAATVIKDTPTTIKVVLKAGPYELERLAPVTILAAPTTPPPIAKISGAREVLVNMALPLSSNDSSGEQLTYAWTATGFTPATSTQAHPIFRAPASPGNHMITLVVTDRHGRSAGAIHEVSVTAQSLPTCKPLWQATQEYVLNDEVSYDGYDYRGLHWSQGARPDLNWVPEGYSKPWRRLTTCVVR
jgi:chitodextrinase